MINLDHLERLLGPHGLFEHAKLHTPRPEHGYCTDDNARALVVTAGIDTRAAANIFERCLEFVVRARTPAGWHNRRSHAGEWLDEIGPEDSHGRVVWGLGMAARQGRLSDDLLPLFEEAARRPLHHLRSVAYALLGAVAALGTRADAAARQALTLHLPSLPAIRTGEWRWPEPRLTYDNARIPQAMLVAGAATGELATRDTGLALLRWLVEVEGGGRRFSFTPVGGRGPGESGPAFDQQPIEAWGMAEACEEAARVDDDPVWWERAEAAADWFRGRNDLGVPLYDPQTGAGYDGLEEDGVNRNCGAESTLSALGAELVRGRIPHRRTVVAPP